MLVSWKWLKELIDIDLAPEEAARILTRAGLEVEGLEKLDKGVTKVVTGRILSVEPHPNAKKLVVCQVDAGQDKPLRIVTGAPNVKAGQCVPVALVGAKLPCSQHPEIVLSDLRGVISEGMMCSAEEIGLDVSKLTGEEKEGLYPLPADTEPGQPIIPFLGLDDVILEIGLTPNRSDCMGMVNIARELAALTGARLTLPQTPASQPGGECGKLATVEIMEEGLCSRFGGRMVVDVEVGPSPQWMRQRLMAMGMRSINNVVDVSNLVMLELNRPVHFFDYDKLVGQGLWIRKAKEGEMIQTLDGQERRLTQEMALVTDQGGPVAIAGVMGGLRTEVTKETKRILIEAAAWNGVRTRRTSFALGLRSEASARFEKEVDVEETIHTVDRCVQLIEECGAGRGLSGHIDVYPKEIPPTVTEVRLERINFVLGTAIHQEEVKKIWLALQIRILEDRGDSWRLEAPSWRRDLAIEEDYIEEVARIYGYDKLEATLPYGATTQGYRSPLYNLRRKITSLLIGQGFSEVINYSFINPAHLDRLGVPAEHPWRNTVKILNPLSEEQGILRTTVIPSMISVAAANINRRNKDLMLFEMGKVYFANPDGAKQPEERWTVSLLCGGVKKKTWLSPEEPMDFFTLKGAIQEVLAGTGVKDAEYVASGEIPGLHPGRAAKILVRGREIGYLGEVDPRVRADYDVDCPLQVASLDAAELFAAAQAVSYHPLSKYPEVTRDLAVAVDRQIPAAEVEKVIRRWGGGLLKDVRLFDQYTGVQLGENQKSLAFALTWQAADRTLKDEEIKAFHDTIEAKLGETYGGSIRGR